ncbi:hypothetical protein [Caballeronia glebae]|uniref:hypothetical protein n=1 Tax=Caballeronia glebae TaxID=1777143 RepID=UPI0038BA9377
MSVIDAAGGAVAGAALRGKDADSTSMLKSFGDSDSGGSLLGDAQPFDYVPDDLGQAVDLVAGGEGTPGNNQAQNKQFKAVVRALGLDKNQAQELHMEISKQGLGYQEIMERARDIFGGVRD